MYILNLCPFASQQALFFRFIRFSIILALIRRLLNFTSIGLGPGLGSARSGIDSCWFGQLQYRDHHHRYGGPHFPLRHQIHVYQQWLVSQLWVGCAPLSMSDLKVIQGERGNNANHVIDDLEDLVICAALGIFWYSKNSCRPLSPTLLNVIISDFEILDFMRKPCNGNLLTGHLWVNFSIGCFQCLFIRFHQVLDYMLEFIKNKVLWKCF